MSEQDLDFSLDGVPAEWKTVEVERTIATARPKRRRKTKAASVNAHAADLYSGTVAALITGASCGIGWFFLERNAVGPLPYMAVPVAFALVFAIRAAAGPGDRDLRAVLSVVVYMLTVIVTSLLVSRYQYIHVMGSTPNLDELDHWLVRTRLEDPMTMLNWLGGFWVSIHLSYRLGNSGR